MQITPPLPDAATATSLGELVNLCYYLYGQDPTDLTPPLPKSVARTYSLVRHITMEDFYGKSKVRVFYGFLLMKVGSPGEFYVVMRGTDNWYEVWDDWRSMDFTLWPWWPARVGKGFFEVYMTMRPRPTLSAPDTADEAPETYNFAKDVVEACKEYMRAEHGEAPDASGVNYSYAIAGHSLGSALATLFTGQLAAQNAAKSLFLCTFASPRVGDGPFAAGFNAFKTITCWRIANNYDAVTYVPDFGFQHVNTLYSFSSTNVCPGLICYHSLDTYLYCVSNGEMPLRNECVYRIGCDLKMISTPAPDFALPDKV